MKKLVSHFLLACVLSLLLPTGLRAQSFELADQIEVRAIKSMSITRQDNVFKSTIIVFMTNASDRMIRFVDTTFTVHLQPAGGEKVYYGRGVIKELDLPAAKGTARSDTEVPITLEVGRNQEDCMERLLKIFNIVGNPSIKLEMLLEAKGEVGVQTKSETKRGMSYQMSRVELVFTPHYTKEVLFE